MEPLGLVDEPFGSRPERDEEHEGEDEVSDCWGCRHGGSPKHHSPDRDQGAAFLVESTAGARAAPQVKWPDEKIPVPGGGPQRLRPSAPRLWPSPWRGSPGHPIPWSGSGVRKHDARRSLSTGGVSTRWSTSTYFHLARRSARVDAGHRPRRRSGRHRTAGRRRAPPSPAARRSRVPNPGRGGGYRVTGLAQGSSR